MNNTYSNNQLIILDRDGVINFDSDDYIRRPEEWLPIEGSLKAIAALNNAGYNIAVATNQSGLSRQYFDEITLAMIHKKMELELAKVGGHINAIEYCGDHPDNAGPCRKPNPGMALKLLQVFNADPQQTWFIGDSKSDLECAINAGCKPVLVLTGKGQKTLEKGGLPQELPVFENLAAFVKKLLG